MLMFFRINLLHESPSYLLSLFHKILKPKFFILPKMYLLFKKLTRLFLQLFDVIQVYIFFVNLVYKYEFEF